MIAEEKTADHSTEISDDFNSIAESDINNENDKDKNNLSNENNEETEDDIQQTSDNVSSSADNLKRLQQSQSILHNT